ncbi:hypothetical protein VNI00_001141 [Paramarasmius palmivorus]|uniref:Uncharacterized protein n=1 Tax=Paramarasmius palmivorus TaxID=297713 RepID=A0AAW0E923_9AGAR
MLEPVAAVIVNTVLCGRSQLERPATLQSISRVVTNCYPNSRRALAPDFFNPQPRRVVIRAEEKGKARAILLDEGLPPSPPEQAMEWSCTNGRALFPYRRPAYKTRPLKRTSFQRSVSTTIHRQAHTHTSPRLLSRARLSHSHNGQQRRQASQVAEPHNSLPTTAGSSSERFKRFDIIIPAGPGYDPKLIVAQHLRRMLDTPMQSLDIDKALAVYEAVCRENALEILSVEELLTFLERVLDVADLHYGQNTDIAKLDGWGTQLLHALRGLDSRIVMLSDYMYRQQCDLSRAYALVGQLEKAMDIAYRTTKLLVEYEARWRSLRAYNSIVLATHRYFDCTRVLNLAVQHWQSLGSYLSRWSKDHHHGEPEHYARLLRKNTFDFISQIQHPVLLLIEMEKVNDSERQRAGRILIEAYCQYNIPLLALEVFDELKRQQLSAPLDLHLFLVQSLVKEAAIGPAKKLFASIPSDTLYKYYLRTGLSLFAHDGDSERAKFFWAQLEMQSWQTEVDIGMLMHSYATKGNSDQVAKMFDEFFPQDDTLGRRRNRPKLLHYAIALYSHAVKGDITGLNHWLGEISRANLRPDVYVFTVIMQAFAKRGDLNSVSTILTQMRENGIPPNDATYMNLITLLANRRDPMGAEHVYKRALSEGVKPNGRMLRAVMDAHVEAGSWKGAIRVFDYIRSNPALNIRLTIEAYNTILKAYVLIGAPFRITARLFKRLEQMNVKPDSYTYALIMQSACDAGQLRIARLILKRLEKQSADWANNLQVTIYVLTVMMGGLLRAKKVKEARAIYNEMLERGIQPDSIAFSTILHAYGNEKSEESLKLAEEFIRGIIHAEEKPWITSRYSKTTALEHIYGPLIATYARMDRITDVERLYQSMIEEAGGEPTLGTLTTLLDAYRRVGNINEVERLWPQIFEMGKRYAKDPALFLISETPEDPTRTRLQSNILCIPLSIYIDALSSAGRHLQIAEVWTTFQKEGFFFDSNNWNHLIVALVRAGEIARAFHIVEKIILPFQRQALKFRANRDPAPSSPLSFVREEAAAQALDDEEDAYNPQTRVAGWKLRRRNLRRSDRRLDTDLAILDYRATDFGSDFSAPLHFLQQISPAWNVWQLHRVSVSALIWSYETLKSGRLVKPTLPSGASNASMSLNPDDDSEKAEVLFQTIHEQYPDACTVLMEYRRKLKERHGPEKYVEMFGA